MRRRIILLVLAIGSLILISFMLPLALLLRTFTAENAVNSATIRAQFMAPLIATLSQNELRLAVTNFNQQNPSEPLTVFLPDGSTVGATALRSAGVQLASEAGKSFAERAPGGAEIFVAVLGLPHGNAVVRIFVPDAQLQRGVTQAWLVLGAIALGLLALGVTVALQLTRSLVRPLRNVASVAERLAQGDLTARATDDGPPEILQVSEGLNWLAVRIGQLLAHERETLADLSHRLRTPLTALRIDAELVSGDEELTTRLISDVDALTATVNTIIAEARQPGANGAAATCDAAAVVRDRVAYWGALAEDQERWMAVEIPPYRLPVRVSVDDLASCVDILLENVFAHTTDGTPFSVRVSSRSGGGAWLAVSDAGSGFQVHGPVGRGNSGGGSTGLGLDIARRIAENSGGTLTVGRSPQGGGAVTIGFGGAAPSVRPARRHVRVGRAARYT